MAAVPAVASLADTLVEVTPVADTLVEVAEASEVADNLMIWKCCKTIKDNYLVISTIYRKFNSIDSLIWFKDCFGYVYE